MWSDFWLSLRVSKPCQLGVLKEKIPCWIFQPKGVKWYNKYDTLKIPTLLIAKFPHPHPMICTMLLRLSSTRRFECNVNDLAPVVQRLDNAIHWINHCINVLSIHIRWIAIYPVDSIIQPLNNWALGSISNVYLSFSFWGGEGWYVKALLESKGRLRRLVTAFKTLK